MEGPFDLKEKDKWDDMVQKFANLEDSIIDLKEELANCENREQRELIEGDLEEETKFYNIAYNAVGEKAYVIRNKSKYSKHKKINRLEIELKINLGIMDIFLNSFERMT